jgi:hypothetical protein
MRHKERHDSLGRRRATHATRITPAPLQHYLVPNFAISARRDPTLHNLRRQPDPEIPFSITLFQIFNNGIRD